MHRRGRGTTSVTAARVAEAERESPKPGLRQCRSVDTRQSALAVDSPSQSLTTSQLLQPVRRYSKRLAQSSATSLGPARCREHYRLRSLPEEEAAERGAPTPC